MVHLTVIPAGHARPSGGSYVLENKNQSTSGQHRIRTCDLYGVNEPGDTRFRASEMRVFTEDNGSFAWWLQLHHLPRFRPKTKRPQPRKRGAQVTGGALRPTPWMTTVPWLTG